MDVAQLITFARESQGALKWDISSLIHIGGQLAVKVNGIQNLTGQEKGKLVCQVLKTVLEDVEKKEKAETQVDEEKVVIGQQFASLRKAVDEVVPASLDLALAAARGKLDLKKVKMSVWVRYFSCCARSVVTALVSNNVISQSQAKQAADVLAAVEKRALAGCEGPADEAAEKAEAATSEAATSVAEEDKTRFEQANPMHTQTQEGAKTESKDVEVPKPSESKQDTTQ